MDLSKMDLGGGSAEASSGEETLNLDGSSSPTLVEAPLHNTTEDLHLYYKQSFASRVGATGLFIIAALTIGLALTTAILIFSYTSTGREFLQNLSIIIF